MQTYLNKWCRTPEMTYHHTEKWDTCDASKSHQWPAVRNLVWCKPTPVSSKGTPVKTLSYLSELSGVLERTKSHPRYRKWDTKDKSEIPQWAALAQQGQYRVSPLGWHWITKMTWSHLSEWQWNLRLHKANIWVAVKNLCNPNHPSEWQWDIWDNREPPQWAAVGHCRGLHEGILVSVKETPETTLSHTSKWQWKSLHDT